VIRLGRRGGRQELDSGQSQLPVYISDRGDAHVRKQVRAQVRRDGGAEAASAVRKTPSADAAGAASSSIRCTRPVARSQRLRARAGVVTALEPSVGSLSSSVLLRPISPRSRRRSALCRESRPAAHSVSSPRARAVSDTNNCLPSHASLFSSPLLQRGGLFVADGNSGAGRQRARRSKMRQLSLRQTRSSAARKEHDLTLASEV
jgi:hypothetical protein